MGNQGFKYDAFLNHAGEDIDWCEKLAERLRNENVGVWLDKWELQPGDHLLKRLNDALKQSRKMVAVWSPNYFREDKVWTLAESFSQQHQDILAQERLLIPLLIEKCDIPPTFRNIIYIDFRNPEDFEIHFRQLLEALDLPKRVYEREEVLEFREHEFDISKRGKEAFVKGKRFEDEVSKLYQLLGFEVKPDIKLDGMQIDLLIQQKVGGLLIEAVVECKDKQITAAERDQILAQQNVVQKKYPTYRWIAVSSQGFAADTRIALETAGISCTTYSNLLHGLVPIDTYVESLINEYETWVNKNWRGEDWFIRPDVQNDITYNKFPGIARVSKFLGDTRINFLTVLGDLGTGKSTLAKFLAYNLARSFRDDPLRHPAPVLIPLGEVRKEVSLEGIIINHFSRHGIPAINFPRFEHLVRVGKVVLFFDAFDEMADRVRWEVTKSNFTEIRRAAIEKGKVILTCRTHYFKDRAEQVKLIGEGPRLSEVETDLYKVLKQQSDAEVIYLQEFNDDQIQAYLRKARPYNHEEDWKKIKEIYNLKELAHRPLLLDMIVKSLPKLEVGQQINASNLYNVYTNLWIEREEQKGRFLDKNIKLQLMYELAWRMWNDEKNAIYYNDLIPFVEKLSTEKVMELGDEDTEVIAREMQAATFLKRDDKGNFSFVHRSFMEFFLARKLLECITNPQSKGNAEIALNTRRLDRKTVYFLSLLDEKDSIIEPLQQILIKGYSKNVSENALQILYWTGRIKNGMEDKIEDVEKLKLITSQRIPRKAQLTGASLQEIVLECANLTEANFSSADLTKANLNNALFNRTTFTNAKLTEARAEKVVAIASVFRKADLSGVSLTGSNFGRCDFTDAVYQPSSFGSTIFSDVFGLDLIGPVKREGLQAVVQRGSAAGVASVAYHSSGDLVAVGSGDGIIRIYRASDGRLIRVLEGHQSRVRSVHFSPNGETLASGSSDNSVRLWEVKSGKQIRVLEGHQGWVNSVHFSPIGETLASGSYDDSVRLWGVKSGKQICVLEGHNNGMRSVQFSPDGLVLTSGSDDRGVRLWEMKSGRQILVLEGHNGGVRSVRFSTDGLMLASGSYDKNIRLWEVKSGEQIYILEGHSGSVNSVQFSPDRVTLASGSADGSIRLWEVKSGKHIRVLEGHSGSVNSVQFSPDRVTLASGSDDKSVRLWDVKSGKQIYILEGHSDHVYSVHFSPNGETLASGSSDDSVRLWEVKNGKQIRALEGHSGGVRSVHFSLDGLTLASGSYDRSVRLWNLEDGKCIGILDKHLGAVYDVAFAPNLKYLIVVGAAGRLQFWDTEKYETFLYRYSFGPGAWLDLLPDGRFDGSPEGMRYLCYTQKDTLVSLTAEELVKEFYDPEAIREVIEKYTK